MVSVIEQEEMNGSPGLIYLESTSQANGVGQITLTFESGTSVDFAQVDVQNRLSRARAAPAHGGDAAGRSRRPRRARTSCCSRSSSSDNPAFDPIALGDYASRTVLPEIQRLPGVGQAQLVAFAEQAMRIWVDPAKLVGFNLSPNDVNNAIGRRTRRSRREPSATCRSSPTSRSAPPSSSAAS